MGGHRCRGRCAHIADFRPGGEPAPHPEGGAGPGGGAGGWNEALLTEGRGCCKSYVSANSAWLRKGPRGRPGGADADVRSDKRKHGASLAPGGCGRSNPRPAVDVRRREAARQAPADVLAIRGYGRLRRGHQCRQGQAHGPETREEGLPVAYRVSGRPETGERRKTPPGEAEAGSGAGHSRNVAEEPAGARATNQAEGLRRAGPSASGPETAGREGHGLKAGET